MRWNVRRQRHPLHRVVANFMFVTNLRTKSSRFWMYTLDVAYATRTRLQAGLTEHNVTLARDIPVRSEDLTMLDTMYGESAMHGTPVNIVIPVKVVGGEKLVHYRAVPNYYENMIVWNGIWTTV